MRSKWKLPVIAGCLVALAAILTVVHFTTRVKVPDGAIAVEINGTSTYLVLADLPTACVTGEIVNGKGDVSTIDGEGIRLEDVLTIAGADAPKRVTAIADDEYRAVIEGDELARGIQAYLLIEDGEGRLIVFGDSNSKRNVAHLIRLVIE